jgi:hypothetical protein
MGEQLPRHGAIITLPTLGSPDNERRLFYVPMQMSSKSQKYPKTVSMHSECSASNGAELFFEFPMRIKNRIQSSQSPIRKRSTRIIKFKFVHMDEREAKKKGWLVQCKKVVAKDIG